MVFENTQFDLSEPPSDTITGKSLLGTLQAPKLPDFLTNNVCYSAPCACLATVDFISLSSKAFPGVIELLPLQIRSSSHQLQVCQLIYLAFPSSDLFQVSSEAMTSLSPEGTLPRTA